VSIRDIPLTTIDGSTTTLAELGEKAVMVVNVASRCGNTPQYSALQSAYEKYHQ
jgi:glutathione peroxidase